METSIKFKELLFPTPKEVVQRADKVEPITGFTVNYLTKDLQAKLNHYFPKEQFRQPNYSLVVSYALDIKGYILELTISSLIIKNA